MASKKPKRMKLVVRSAAIPDERSTCSSCMFFYKPSKADIKESPSLTECCVANPPTVELVSRPKEIKDPQTGVITVQMQEKSVALRPFTNEEALACRFHRKRFK